MYLLIFLNTFGLGTSLSLILFLNPEKSIVGYNSSDVNKLINYSKNLEQINIMQNNEIKTNDITIEKLTKENESFKDIKEIIKRNDIIKEQKTTINEQKKEINRLSNLVDILNHNIESLKTKLEREVDKWKRILKKVCKAIDKVLDRKPKYELEDHERLTDAINLDYYDYKNHKKELCKFQIIMARCLLHRFQDTL